MTFSLSPESTQADLAFPPSTACEVCGRDGADAARCKFGHVKGPCSCWRGVPCDVKAAPAQLVDVAPSLWSP